LFEFWFLKSFLGNRAGRGNPGPVNERRKARGAWGGKIGQRGMNVGFFTEIPIAAAKVTDDIILSGW
jgi:hypothetical protein